MKLARLSPDPAALADFYQEALDHLGAVCERTWFDRVQLVAEGTAARLWNTDGGLHELELHFPPPDASAPRDAAREVFPGCPLTFRLTEAIRPQPIPFERGVLATVGRANPPTLDVAEKLWHAQMSSTTRWRMETAFFPAHHFSLLALVRCEIQAIDQHWSLHRLTMSLPGGEADPSLADELNFAQLSPDESPEVIWPAVATPHLQTLLSGALNQELETELGLIRKRQENYLRRELDRVDDYFAGYEKELNERARRSGKDATKLKLTERLAAARTEHTRRRDDQVQRHAIRVIPHFDALLLLAEPAWQTRLALTRRGETQVLPARFVPRCRRWFVLEAPPALS